ncbi:unnamed protein product [Caenorhabditis auriculariae]|uniref:Uncharacterized protein n=1 Tax=Caenorhabditis auriculariae TaxID=2777116 RepID=A0A8S1HG63_9PELO|nr:unnamed protein product [Caenorhabditis auriculariae]
MSSQTPDLNSRRACDPPKEFEGRICVICADRASGYNFGILTCESCKAFFRRNALRVESIKCPFSNSCEITASSRRFCQACRLSKCFRVGMNNQWLTDAKNSQKLKRKKIKPHKVETTDEEEDKVSVSKAYLEELQKKAKKRPSSCSCTCTCGFYERGTKLSEDGNDQTVRKTSTSRGVVSPPFGTPSPLNVEEHLTTAPIGFSAIRAPPPSVPVSIPQFTQLPPAPNVLPRPTAFPAWQQMGQYLHSATAFNLPGPSMAPVSRWDVFHDLSLPFSSDYHLSLSMTNPEISKYSNLTEEELLILDELYITSEPLKDPIGNQYNQNEISGVLKISGEALQRILVMAGRLQAFRDLEIHDRMQLVKSGFGELLAVRGLMAFDRESKTWRHSSEMEVKIDVLKIDGPELQLFMEQYFKLVDATEDIRTNYTIMLLLTAIVIFRPELPNLKEQHKVCRAQNIYYGILLKVLQVEFPREEAMRKYNRLLALVVELHTVNKAMVRVFCGFDHAVLDPLLRELCDKI